eukprot:6887271-Alexandrium_andersonii.AAC.1
MCIRDRAAKARAAATQRGDLRAGAAPLTAPGLWPISLMRPSGRRGPRPRSSIARPRAWDRQRPRPPCPRR